ATRSPAQGCGTKSVPRQGHNTPLPLKRSPPASFKRLLGSTLSNRELLHSRREGRLKEPVIVDCPSEHVDGFFAGVDRHCGWSGGVEMLQGVAGAVGSVSKHLCIYGLTEEMLVDGDRCSLER